MTLTHRRKTHPVMLVLALNTRVTGQLSRTGAAAELDPNAGGSASASSEQWILSATPSVRNAKTHRSI